MVGWWTTAFVAERRQSLVADDATVLDWCMQTSFVADACLNASLTLTGLSETVFRVAASGEGRREDRCDVSDDRDP
jgi:hypothetical protein